MTESDSDSAYFSVASEPLELPKGCHCQQPATNSSSHKPRNLVISIDGTSNKFGSTNTNVIELYSHILKGEASEQLTYYDSGIGTYARPSWKSWSYLKQVVNNKVDLVIAWNLEKVIIRAYRWLSNHYREGDKIFLFGFSRGAFQVRALAGMIEMVGLILPGNESQIPFAYELYANYDAEKDSDIVPVFKTTFSTNVRVHFVGVWDTVSSVGFLRGKKMLPRVVDCCNHVCYFRHALALDERRVKFLPEYVHEGLSHTEHEPPFPGHLKCTTDIKEVWFAGSHSDVGGGNRVNKDLQSGDIPLLWMRNEAIMAGLHLKAADINWKSKDLERKPMESLGAMWQILEQFPMRRLSYKGHKAVSHRPHQGKSRKIVEGQKIHASVIFRPGYRPRPAFPKNLGTWPMQLHWDDPDRHERLNELDDIWEKDLFDHSAVEDLFKQLKKDVNGCARILERIAFMASLEEGQAAISRLDSVLEILKPFVNREITSVESKLIKISAAAAFSNLISEEDTNNIDCIIKSECLDLAISLLQPKDDEEKDGWLWVKKPRREATTDIERIIKDRAKAKRRSARQDPQKSRGSNEKVDIDSRTATPDTEQVPNIAEEPNENIKACNVEMPRNAKQTKVVDEVIKDVNELQREAHTLRINACLAIAAFVHHESLRSTIIAKGVLKTLVRLCYSTSEDMSTASAQALLHMLVFEDVAEHVVHENIATEIIGLVLEEKSNIPVSAARILEELAEWPCTRRVMAENTAVNKLFSLLDSKSDNHVKLSRLNALCHFAKYDELRPDLLKINIVSFLIKRTSPQIDKHRRKECLAALIKLAEDETTRKRILEAQFVNNLMRQLACDDTERDAQRTLVSLAKYEEFRPVIINAGLIQDIVKRLEKNKTFDDAQDTLAALIEYSEFREALLKSSFILTLENAIVKGGVALDDLGDAMSSFCRQDQICQGILASKFVEIMLNNARKGTMWGMEVTSRILQSEFLKNAKIRQQIMNKGLVSMLHEVVNERSLFALTFVPAILSGVGEHDDMRNAVLDTDIICMLARRMRHVSLSAHVFTKQCFHDDIIAEFGIYGLKLGDLEPTSLSLSKVFQLSQENTNVIRSFLYMMAAHPQGFVRMLKYGENDDW